MYTAQDVADALESVAPRELGVAGDNLGIIYGDPKGRVDGVACLWHADSRSLAAAAAQGLNMVVCHEALFTAPQESPWYQGPSADQIRVNQLRREVLEAHKMIVCRAHSNWDALPVDGVRDQAIAALGIAGLTVVGAQKFFAVNRLPAALTVAQLRDAVAAGLRYPHCRIFGDASRRIRQFAILIGGFGENQRHIPQVAMELGAEALIFGEMSEFIVLSALELGLPVIESLHSISEIPAIRRQAEILAARLPGINVSYVPSGAATWS